MSHSQIEKALYDAITKSNDGTAIRNARVADIYVDILQTRKGEKIAFEIKTANFFDGLGRAVVWKDYVDSVYLVVPKSILPPTQVVNAIPDQIGVVAYEYDSASARFTLLKKARVDLPSQIFEHGIFFDTKLRPPERYVAASLVSPKALRLLRYLLLHGRTSQQEISEKTHVSLGMVNKVISRLAERDIVAYKKRTLTLLEPYKLLNEISWERPMSKLKIRDLYLPHIRDAQGAEEYLKNTCSQYEVEYALTLFSAANRYVAYSMRYDTVYSYVEPSDRVLQFETEADSSTEKGMRIELFRVDSPDILDEAGTIDGLSICDPTQVLIDLSSYGNVGKDVAVELYRRLSER